MSDLGVHGASKLASVTVEGNNTELKDSEGFVGDRASKRAFSAILDDWREKLKKVSGEDPLGEMDTADISKRKLDKILVEGDTEAAGLVLSAVEEFAEELAAVTGKILKLKEWKGVQRIVMGGGFRASRMGELAIGRASVLLKSEKHEVDLVPIRNHPDHAGLIGAVHLAPSWIFKGHDAILAVDIGGSNIRAGVVILGKKKDLSTAEVIETELWRHAAEETTPKRDEAVEKMIAMLQDLVKRATKAKLTLAPFVGVGCPGFIEPDGSIAKGGQNLPGNWESSKFNLPERIIELLPEIAGEKTSVIMHNDAVVQGLSEVPFMQDIDKWGVLTIGTGLGNAVFSNNHSK